MDLRESSHAAIEARENGLALVGEFDLFLSGVLEDRIKACASGGACFVLDLTHCTYVDSTILTVFVRAANAYEGQLQMIVPPSGNVARILSITKLDRNLPLI